MFIGLFLNYIIMSQLTIEILKEIVDKLPEDFIVGFNDKDVDHIISDKFEVDVSSKKLVLKKY